MYLFRDYGRIDVEQRRQRSQPYDRETFAAIRQRAGKPVDCGWRKEGDSPLSALSAFTFGSIHQDRDQFQHVSSVYHLPLCSWLSALRSKS